MSSEHSINGFMIACGMIGPLELEVEDRRDGSIERRVYHQPYVLIGRTSAADLPLDDDQVSRRHAYIQVVAGRVYCVDLASRSGLHWDGGTYGSGWLDRGRNLKVGPFVIRLRDGVPPAAGQGQGHEPAASRPRRLPRVALEFLDHPDGLAPWHVTRKLTLVGRSPVCQLLLSGAEVSRFHAALIRSPMGIWVVDLMGGRKGMAVNGRLVRSGILSDGDEIEVGHHRMLVRYGRPATARGQSSGASGLALPWQVGPPPSPGAMTGPGSWPTLAPGALPFPMPVMPTAATGWSPESAATEVRAMLAGRPPEQVELAESLLIPVVHQFGHMQMQMFDQFQQMLGMLFQMFSSMHRDQMDVVREELGHIRRLTDELQATQKLLQEQKPTQTQAGHAAKGEPPLSPVPPPAAPRSPAASPSALSAGSPPGPDAATVSSHRERAPKEGEGARELHSILAKRIATMQQERQSRWQKLVQMLSGGGTGRPPGS